MKRALEDIVKSMSSLEIFAKQERIRRRKWDTKFARLLAGLTTSPSEVVVRRALVQMKSSRPSDAVTRARIKNIAKARKALALKRKMQKADTQ
jgi:hypothetical protein